MEFTEFVLAIVGVSTTGSVIRAWIDYKQKAAEAKVQASSKPDETLRGELEDLRTKITELRDVTTQYDMSFDSALHRVEGRLSGVEQRLNSVEDQSRVQTTR